MKPEWFEITEGKIKKNIRISDISMIEEHYDNDNFSYCRFFLSSGTTVVIRPDSTEELEKLENFCKERKYDSSISQ